jgi:hypothetical protein
MNDLSPVVLDPCAVASCPLSFEQVSEHPSLCRWPLDEAGWCGAPTAGRKPFCAEHAARAYLPREPDPAAATAALEAEFLDRVEVA